jgi:hypothetical protein
MKKSVLARPNLKIFVFGAVLVLIVQHLVNDGLSQNSGNSRPVLVHAREVADPEVERILALVGRAPSSHIYARLSDHYEEKGEYRLALRYLRLATLMAEAEAEME